RLTLAAALVARQDWPAARAELETALAAQPELLQAGYTLGVVRYAQGDLTGAIDAYRRVLAREPRAADARYNLALVLKLARREAEATPEFLAAAEAGLPRAQYFAGAAYATGAGVERDLVAAITWWMRAAGRAPGRRAGVRRVSRAALEGLSGLGARGRRAPRCRAPASGPRGRGGRRAHSGSGGAERARPASARDALRPGDRRPAARARRADLRLPQERRRRGALAPASLKTLGRAALLAVGATLIAAVVSLLGGAGVTALDWSVYDRWLRARAPVMDTPRLVVVARDPTSGARFGTGAWDRAVVARVVAALARGGAAVARLDVPLGAPRAPGRRGASS